MNRSFLVMMSMTLVVAAGCAGAKKRAAPLMGPPEPGGTLEIQNSGESYGPPVPNPAERPANYGPAPIRAGSLALIFGGGGARGFCHAGVLRALSDARIPVSVVGGVEMGALIAALYAGDPKINRFEWGLLRFKPDFFEDEKGFFSSMISGRGKKSQLEAEIKRFFGKRDLIDMKIPLRIALLLKDSGKTLVLDRGEPATVVLGALQNEQPVMWQGSPVVAATSLRELIEEVKALNLGPVVVLDSGMNPVEAEGAALVLRPELKGVLPTDYEKRNEVIFKCKKVVTEKLTEIKALISNEIPGEGLQR